ncbi:MAG: HAD-IB family hydrolase [Candidatus Poribacteria bacterium]|nr:HAD-IB family hydrolase [Candidatus Poribacteria bacterium]
MNNSKVTMESLGAVVRTNGNQVNRQVAAFFDVDGTLVNSTIVHYYVRFRLQLLHPLIRPFWLAGFLLKIPYYLLLDNLSRTKFNQVFYRNYRGMEVERLKRLALDTFDALLGSKIFPEGADQVREHKAKGDLVVLVTGSLDFIMAPLADYLDADHTLSMSLTEHHGKFTGELMTTPLGEEEKARVAKAFAHEHGIDLAASFAYGDSRADLPMLRCVGTPVVVNPGKALRQIATESGWKICEWSSKPD